MRDARPLAIWIGLMLVLEASCVRSGSNDPSPPPPPPDLQSAIGTWYDSGGEPLPQSRPFVMDVSRGPEHCGWQDLLFLTLSWPLGTRVRGPFMGDERTRVFVRLSTDDDLPSSYFATTFDPRAELPTGARDSGYHREDWHLWVSDSRIDRAVWLVNGATVERWPAMTELVGCA